MLHPLPISMAVMKEIKPVFKDLCDRTQNANESLNNRVRAICPKTSNSGHKIVKIAAYDAVGTFNDGLSIS